MKALKSIPLSYGLFLPLLVVVVDQITKWLATRAFDLPMSICKQNPYIEEAELQIEISPIVDLGMLCNQGVSWNLLQGDSDLKRWGLLIFALIMIVVLYSILKDAKDWFSKLSVGLVIGGAFGNAIDRALFGAVTDFIDASDIGFNYVFNIADSAISAGITGLILAMFLEWRSERKAAASAVE